MERLPGDVAPSAMANDVRYSQAVSGQNLQPLAVLAIAVLAAAACVAQEPSADNAGYGCFYHNVELDPQTGNVLHLGVAVAESTGHSYVSATGLAGVPPHQIYEFDPLGRFLASSLQPSIHQGSSFGIGDMAHDGQNLIGGSEMGITVFTPGGVLVNQVRTNNGVQPIVQPIRGPALAQLGNIRALAYDPQGNGGAGSLFVANLASPILEIDLSGSVLRTIPNGGWSAYGLAVDPTTSNLWVSATIGGEVGEIDRVTGQLTGNVLPLIDEGTVPGGLSPASSQDSLHELWPSQFLLAQIGQSATGSDRLAIQRAHLYPGVAGYDEPQLQGAVSGQPTARKVVHFASGDALDFVLQTGPAVSAGSPCWTVVNAFFDAGLDAYTPVGPSAYFAEWRTLSDISLPSTPNFLVSAQSVGVVSTLTIPPTLLLTEGHLIRMQSVYALPQSPFFVAASNELNFVVNNGERGIVVSAEGPSSFQNNPATPFWKVSSDGLHGHGDILSVDLSFTGAVGSASGMRFDLDQMGLGDRFDGGNSTLPGCSGTYRNNSDVLCGLDYQAPGVYVDSQCHQAGESSGAVATMLPGSTADATALLFQFQSFNPGKVFAFDCDTDGGPFSGDAHAGMQVRVQTSGSGMLAGVLVVDPARPYRSVVFFP